MSTILDALEKASKKKDAAGARTDAGPTLRERQLEQEVERGRRTTRIGAAIALLAIFGVGAYMMSSRKPPAATRAVGAAPEPTPAHSRPLVMPPEATATPFPTPTPYPSPTPYPTPAPTPQTSPTPTPTQTPAMVPSELIRRSLRDGQVISASELGWNITGMMELGNSSYVLIDGDEVQTGTHYRGYHIIAAAPGMLTLDLGDGRVVKAAY